MKNGTSFLFRRSPRQLHTLWLWGVRGLAILVALELGVLSPLSCVLHCLIQQWMIERATPNFFLCDLHRDGAIAQEATPLTATQPRAVYEALPPLYIAALLVVPLLLLLTLLHQVWPLSLALPPPTPPPRVSTLGSLACNHR